MPKLQISKWMLRLLSKNVILGWNENSMGEVVSCKGCFPSRLIEDVVFKLFCYYYDYVSLLTFFMVSCLSRLSPILLTKNSIPMQCNAPENADTFRLQAFQVPVLSSPVLSSFPSSIHCSSQVIFLIHLTSTSSDPNPMVTGFTEKSCSCSQRPGCSSWCRKQRRKQSWRCCGGPWELGRPCGWRTWSRCSSGYGSQRPMFGGCWLRRRKSWWLFFGCWFEWGLRSVVLCVKRGSWVKMCLFDVKLWRLMLWWWFLLLPERNSTSIYPLPHAIHLRLIWPRYSTFRTDTEFNSIN